jgi:hypothetical protein
MFEIVLFAILSIAGVALAVRRPLAKSYKISESWEIGVGAVAVILFCFYLTTQLVMPNLIEQDLAKQPCGVNSPQGACYDLTHSVCEVAWQNAEQTCKVEFSVVQQSRPTALIGPSLNRCKARKMDQTLHFNRKNESSTYCRAYFDYIAGH